MSPTTETSKTHSLARVRCGNRSLNYSVCFFKLHIGLKTSPFITGIPEDDAQIEIPVVSEFMWDGNANTYDNPMVCSSSKRKYNFVSRKKAAKIERFRKSKLATLKDIQEALTSSCKCKRKCWKPFMKDSIEGRILSHRNEFHKLTNRTDRRLYLSRLVTTVGATSYAFLGIPACVQFVVGLMAVSLNQFYGVINRREMNLPISSQLQRHRNGITREEAVCGWLRDLADLQDPQPDKPFVILAHRRKIHVFEEYAKDIAKGTVPKVSRCYFLRVWKRRLASKIVVRKCMRFALCDTCCRIQEHREGDIFFFI